LVQQRACYGGSMSLKVADSLLYSGSLVPTGVAILFS
jgi:hypothetical protein